MLPSIDRLAAANRIPRPTSCRMLVLAPTRELAGQIAESAAAYSRFSRLSVAVAFGGSPIGKQRRALERGVDVLVATPGRLLDLVEQRYLTLREVEILVLDEADQMLDLGFIHALKQDRYPASGQAADPVLLGHHAQDHPRARRQVPDQSGRSSRSPRRRRRSSGSTSM